MDLRCTECGAATEANCSCGATYDYIPARDAARQALVVHPDWSDKKLAEAVGVGAMTIARARKSGSPDGDPEKRVGRDGKKQAARQHKPALRLVPKLECEADPRIDYRSRLVNLLIEAENIGREFLDETRAPVFDYQPLANAAGRVAEIWAKVAAHYKRLSKNETDTHKRQHPVSKQSAAK